jgi:methylthioxylose transferase
MRNDHGVDVITNRTETHAFVRYPIPLCPVTTLAVKSQADQVRPPRWHRWVPRDLIGWALLAGAGVGLTALALHWGARLGTASAPFLGRYRFQVSPLSVIAPAIALLFLACWPKIRQLRWGALLAVSYLTALAWALGLALVDGAAGLTRSLLDPSNYAPDVASVDDQPGRYIATYTANVTDHSIAARGHPPGSVLLLWAFERMGVRDQLTLAVFLTALATVTVPLVLFCVRSVCGEVTARRYAPVLVLAPYAIWVAVSMDAVVAMLGAAMCAAGVFASAHGRRGLVAATWSVITGLMIGFAAMFSYAVVWLGLSVVLLYFARRRAFLNIGTGIGALLPVLLANHLGFGWLAGVAAANSDFAARVEPFRSAPWWAILSIVALVLAAGPPIFASARKIRNTPAWPFLVGATTAVLFSVCAGLARGGVEAAWLPFFPWLTVAAAAPERQGGDPPPMPWSLVIGGVVTAVVIEAVLATPW